MSRRSDMELVAALVKDRPEAAERLAQRSAQAEFETSRANALEFELKWLLGHAREKPVQIVTDDDGEFLRADPAQSKDGRSYLLVDCPRLLALMKGEIPASR